VNETWQLRAACRGPASTLFFPPSATERKEEREAREAKAKLICSTCPVQRACLDYALDTKKEKDVARDMIKMVMTINTDTKAIGDAAMPEKVSCFTCHRGDKKPAFTPTPGWARGNFSLSEAGPVVPARGGGPGGAGAPPAGGPPPGGAPAGGR